MKKRTRLIDIAEKVGVSKMCVSLALRNDPSIGEETRKKVCRVADELGYVPNRMAKGLIDGRTYTIAAIVGGDMHDDYHNQFLKGATDYAISKGYTITIALTEGDREIETEVVKKYYEMAVDGYMIFHSGSKDNILLMKERKIPFVMYTKYFEDIDCDYVVCDDVGGASMLTQYFIQQGHRKIMYLYDRTLEESSEVVNRKKGYRKALEEAGIPYAENLVQPYDYSMEWSYSEGSNKQLLDILKSDERPSAIFVCNDVVASSVLATLKSWGYKIPGDISVAGYEGIYLGTVLDPPLTTVSTPVREMGRKACQLLIEKIEGKVSETTHISMPPKLTIRKSISGKEGRKNQ